MTTLHSGSMNRRKTDLFIEPAVFNCHFSCSKAARAKASPPEITQNSL
jgi:hypothetical protein